MDVGVATEDRSRFCACQSAKLTRLESRALEGSCMNSDTSGSAAAPSPVQPDSVTPSRAVADRGPDRLLVAVRPFLYPALTVLATAIVFLGQLVEDATDSPPLQMFENPPLLARW